jgi:hypothetical protein
MILSFTFSDSFRDAPHARVVFGDTASDQNSRAHFKHTDYAVNGK